MPDGSVPPSSAGPLGLFDQSSPPGTASFVPLSSPAGSKTASPTPARRTVLSGAEAHSAFRALLPVGPTALPDGSVPRPNADSATVRVSLEREGEQVTSIRVRCVCGHLIELKCVY